MNILFVNISKLMPSFPAAIFAIVNSVDTKALYCTAPDWLATLKNPSPFCAVAGTSL